LKFANFGFITAPRVLISFQRAPSTKKRNRWFRKNISMQYTNVFRQT